MQDPQYTQIFIAAIQSLFGDMLNMPAEHTEQRVKQSNEPWLDITGAIGITGSISGTMALTFEQSTAEGLVAEMIGSPLAFDSEDTADAIGEIANIAAGMAKAKLNTDGSLCITCPTVTRGACVTRMTTETDTLAVDFETPVGRLRLELTLIPANTDADTQTAAA